jgi:hypothetical protein
MVNFDHRLDGWAVHCMDGRIRVGPWARVRGDGFTLLRLFRYIGAGEDELAEAEIDLRRWGRGSIHVDLIPGRRNLLQLSRPWSEDLEHV